MEVNIVLGIIRHLRKDWIIVVIVAVVIGSEVSGQNVVPPTDLQAYGLAPYNWNG